MAPSANPSFLRAMLAERLALVLDDVERAAGEVGKQARQECANLLNQAVRRLWQAGDPAALADTLADAAAQFARGAAVLSIEDGMAKLENVRPSSDAWRAAGNLTALDAAPALTAAIESREPVIAAAAESEVGATLAALAAAAGDDRVAVFPLTNHDGVAGLVCAWGTVEAAAVELLAVSYTHLDVYKRQGHDRPGGTRARPDGGNAETVAGGVADGIAGKLGLGQNLPSPTPAVHRGSRPARQPGDAAV